MVASPTSDQDLSFGPTTSFRNRSTQVDRQDSLCGGEGGDGFRRGNAPPIADFDAYIEKLSEFVYKTNLFVKPIFSQARKEPKRVVLAEGEETRCCTPPRAGVSRTGQTDSGGPPERD